MFAPLKKKRCPTKVNSDDWGMPCPSKGACEALGMEGPWDLGTMWPIPPRPALVGGIAGLYH